MRILAMPDTGTLDIEYEGKVVRLTGEFREYRKAWVNETEWLPWDMLIEDREVWIAEAKSLNEAPPRAFATRRDRANEAGVRKIRARQIESGEAKLAWMKAMARPYDADAPLTAEEKLGVMCAVYGHDFGKGHYIDFADDEGRLIYFDPHGRPLVYIDGETIKSAKTDVACICCPFGEIDDFSGPGFGLFQVYVADLVKYRVLRKVHAWKRYGRHKEEWYECKTCKSVWRLVYPDTSFKGLWGKVK